MPVPSIWVGITMKKLTDNWIDAEEIILEIMLGN